MELNITKFFNEACAKDYQASIAEIGENAARDTWQAAIDDSPVYMFVNDDTRDDIQAHFRAYGAWSEDEIKAWSDIELNAILIQDIAGSIREFRELAEGDWEEWEELCNAGTCSSRLFGGDLSVNGEIYFYIGE